MTPLPIRLPPILAALLLTACAGGALPTTVIEGPTMGTRYSVKLVEAPDATDEVALQADIDAVLADIVALMSTWEPDSELSRFNRSSVDEWFAISPDTHTVVAAALEVAEQSGGTFDATAGPLINLWGFGPADTRELPGAEAIAAARALLGRIELRAQPPAMRRTAEGVYVDLSAIAKGYAVDRIAELLEQRGTANYLVEIGGELRARGSNARGRPWAVAVERPLPGGRMVQRVLPLTDRSVATSGDYRNFYERDGKRYSHTIDPRTGRPVEHTLASVSVVHPSAMMADAFATALMVLGPDEGFAWAGRNGLAALFIVRDGTGFVERTTAAFEELPAE